MPPVPWTSYVHTHTHTHTQALEEMAEEQDALMRLTCRIVEKKRRNRYRSNGFNKLKNGCVHFF
jgi:hypothetical protein